MVEVQIKLKECGKGQILGWEDLVRGRKHTTSVRCFSKTGSLVKISAQDYINQMK